MTGRRVLVTGATGFLGGEVVRRLRARGDDVVALVRTPAKAAALDAELVAGDLADEPSIARAVAGCDAVVHCAAVYEVGAPASRETAIRDANVGGTERVLRAALAAGVQRAVYVSTVAVFGNTRGAVADEGYRKPAEVPATSVYEQTKREAHDAAMRVAADGLDLVVVQPGVIYGPGDPSTAGELLTRYLGRKLPLMPFPELGVTPVHRDDVAAGVLLALDRGRAGESYVLAGEPTTMGALVGELARLTGRRPPRFALPVPLVKAIAPLGPVVGPLLGMPPNVRELIRSSDGVTFWASSAKAQRELGWTYRPLPEGLSELVAAHARR